MSCPTGFYSLTPSASASTTCLECPAGSFCATASTKEICPFDFYCPAQSTSAISCSTWYNTTSTGATAESDCSVQKPSPPGYYWPAPTIVPDAQAAMAKSKMAKSQQAKKISRKTVLPTEPLPCPLGTICPITNTPAPVPCPAGQKCPNLGMIEAIDCEEATYCPTGTITPIACPATFYCPAKSAAPTECPAKFYCAEKVSTPVACPAASYCPVGSAQPTACPAGSYCPAGSAAPVPCTTAGQYCPANSAGAQTCPAGYDCSADTNGQFSTATPGDFCTGNFWRQSYKDSSDCSKLTGAAIAIIVCLSVFVGLLLCFCFYWILFGAAAARKRKQKTVSGDDTQSGGAAALPTEPVAAAPVSTDAAIDVAQPADPTAGNMHLIVSHPSGAATEMVPITTDDVDVDDQQSAYKKRIQPVGPTPRAQPGEPAGSPNDDQPPLVWDTDQPFSPTRPM